MQSQQSFMLIKNQGFFPADLSYTNGLGDLHHSGQRPINILWLLTRTYQQRLIFSKSNYFNVWRHPPKIRLRSYMKVKVTQSCPTLQPHGLYSLCISPGQNTGVDSLSLLQGIFPTQESDPTLSSCMQILYVWATNQGSPFYGQEGAKSALTKFIPLICTSTGPGVLCFLIVSLLRYRVVGIGGGRGGSRSLLQNGGQS